MTSAAALRNALLWAAGNDACAFALRQDQYDAFMQAVLFHRLSGRLLRRLNRDPQAIPAPLADAARRLHETTRTDTLQKIELAHRFGTAMRRLGRDDYVILLKGFTLYALMGDPLTMRLSGDLDLTVSDLDGCLQVALDDGFELVRRLDHLAEYAVLRSPTDGLVELHSRFDVTSLSPGSTLEDLAPELHGDVWEQEPRFRVQYLRHADFKAHVARSAVLPDTVRPLRPEIAVLIHAAHMFKNSLRHPYPLPFATIPLDEVATCVDLCGLPGFDAARFTRLVDAFDGHTAVSFAHALAKDLLDADGLPVRSSERLFPINLWWDGVEGGGFPVHVGWDPRQYVYRDTQMSDLVEALGAQDVPCSGASCTFTLLEPRSESSAKRYIARQGDGTFVVTCAISVDPSGMRFRITVPTVRDDRLVGMSVCLQDYRYEVFVNCTARQPFTDYSVRRDAVSDTKLETYAVPEGHVIDLRLPSRVVEHCRVHAFIYGVLVVREQLREWSHVTAGAAVPLRIRVAA